MVAFPIHAWAIVLYLNDIGWIVERNNVWDAIGVGAYGLVIAFVESIFIFLIATALGFLIAKYWDEDTRVNAMGTIILITSIWAILNQLYFLAEPPRAEALVHLLMKTAHPLRDLYLGALAFGALSTGLPVFAILKFQKASQLAGALFERLSWLTVFYFLLDVVSLGIVIARNIQGA